MWDAVANSLAHPTSSSVINVAGDFPAEGMEITHLLVVGDMERSRDFYRDVLGAELYRHVAVS
jgi:catechol-2,3-dioxygenase